MFIKKKYSFMRKISFSINILVTICFVLPQVENVLISSSYTLQKVLTTQKQVISDLKKHVSKLGGINKHTVQKYISKCKTEHLKSMTNEFYLENPINVFALVKRLSLDLYQIEDILEDTNYTRNIRLTYPSQIDYEGATRAIIHLTLIYGLNVSNIANGILTGNFNKNNQQFTDHATPLTSTDCYELAKASEDFYEYEISLAFAIEAQKRSTDKDEYLQNNIEELIETMKTKISKKEDGMKYADELCLKENVRDRRLKCFYKRGPHSFLLLARLRAQVLCENPEVILFHDVISDEEIKEIQKLATIEFSSIKSPGDPNYRLRKAPCLEDHKSAVVAKISRRVLDITGLSFTLADKLTTVNYGLAGYYNPHLDALNHASMEDLPIGYRKYTVLFYLSNVNLGGATIFTKLGLTMFPRKNSALFWVNLHPTGDVDRRTEHASCPIVHGSKWITTKWISDPSILDSCHENDARYPLNLRRPHKTDLSLLSYDTVKNALRNTEIKAD